MKQIVKHIACAFVYILTLPLRVGIAIIASVFISLCLPFFFVIMLHSWACNEGDFELTLLGVYVAFWWYFVILSDWSVVDI